MPIRFFESNVFDNLGQVNTTPFLSIFAVDFDKKKPVQTVTNVKAEATDER